jgi:hypothetical protein
MTLFDVAHEMRSYESFHRDHGPGAAHQPGGIALVAQLIQAGRT